MKSAPPPVTTMLWTAKRAGSGRRGSGDALQHVVDVVVARVGAAHSQHRRLDLEAIDHRRQAQQRDEGDIGVDTPRLEQRRRAVSGAGEREVGERQLERPGIEGDAADRELPTQQARRRPLGLRGDDRRHVEPGRAPGHDDDEHADGDAQPVFLEPKRGRVPAGDAMRPILRPTCRRCSVGRRASADHLEDAPDLLGDAAHVQVRIGLLHAFVVDSLALPP